MLYSANEHPARPRCKAIGLGLPQQEASVDGMMKPEERSGAGEQHAAKQTLIATSWSRQRGLCSQPPQLKRQPLFSRLWTPSHSSRTKADLPQSSGMAAAAPGDTAAAAAAAAAGDSRELVVPPPRPGVLHMCVEYPGYVADEERVLETLGGTAGIARQLQVRIAVPCVELRDAASSAGCAARLLLRVHAACMPFCRQWYQLTALQENPRQLALRLRPGDHNCHATYGVREPSRRLLLKLTRPAPAANGGAGASGSSSGGGDSWTAEVVATLPHTYRFDTPADYQYIAHDSRPVEEQGE